MLQMKNLLALAPFSLSFYAQPTRHQPLQIFLPEQGSATEQPWLWAQVGHSSPGLQQNSQSKASDVQNAR